MGVRKGNRGWRKRERGEWQPSRVLSRAKLTAKGHVHSATAPRGVLGGLLLLAFQPGQWQSVRPCLWLGARCPNVVKCGVTCGHRACTTVGRRASNRGLPVLWTNMESEERPVQAHALQELRVEQAQQRPETCRLRPHAAGCWRLGKSFELLAQVIKHFEFFVCWLPADRLLRAVLGHHRRG